MVEISSLLAYQESTPRSFTNIWLLYGINISTRGGDLLYLDFENEMYFLFSPTSKEKLTLLILLIQYFNK
jgi:hypothetical protein